MYKLIMLPNPILVSDEKINPTEPYLNNGVVFYADSVFDEGNNPNNSNPIVTDHNFKIIAGIEGLPKLDLSAIEIGWVDVEKLAYKRLPIMPTFDKGEIINSDTNFFIRLGWVEGFKASQSLNEKKYSEEDMRKSFDAGIHFNEESSEKFVVSDGNKWRWEDFIQSISKPKEYNVEVEMEDIGNKDKVYNCSSKSEWIPKITNNTIKITKIL